jgi:hypothetical protein
MSQKKLPLDRDVRSLAEKLGYRVHRFNNVRSHWRGFVLQDADDDWDGKIRYHAHTREHLYQHLLRLQELQKTAA